ncbi:MAG: glycoside hydrolase family 9 protein [Ruminococcus sp.]|nr:glycoside hydrolase family 9 protein [Ruminococcus sp.]
MKKRITRSIISSLVSASMLAATASPLIAPLCVNAQESDAPVLGAANETAEGYNMLGQNNFDNGIGFPWNTVQNLPAQQTSEVSDGTYNVRIINNQSPESIWDLQLRHRDLSITAGHKYKVAFDITSTTEGNIGTQIADYKADAPVWMNCLPGTDAWNFSGRTDENGYEHALSLGNLVIKEGLNHFESEFTAQHSIDVAEWTFYYGGKGLYADEDCFPDGTVLKFDNMVLTDLDEENVPNPKYSIDNLYTLPHSNVMVNQIGYYPTLNKSASYVTDADKPLPFEIRDASGTAVYSGTTKVFGEDEDSGSSYTKDSGQFVHIIDFSDFQTPGTYTIFVKDETGVSDTSFNGIEGFFDTVKDGDKLTWSTKEPGAETYIMNQSPEFSISSFLYEDSIVKDAFNYFYQNRSGIAIEPEYITSGNKELLGHKAAHLSDKAYVQSEWRQSYAKDLEDADKDYLIDVTGGWYTEGNYYKQVTDGASAVWALQNAYEFSKAQDGTDKWASENIALPEEGDAPAILKEARYELEWMMKMIVKEDDPYWGEHAGMVYSGVRDYMWLPMPSLEWNEYHENPERIVSPPSYTATLDFAACAAQAARLWKDYDSDFADKCLDAAKKAYAAVDSSSLQYKWDSDNKIFFEPSGKGVGTALVTDYSAEDEYYWAGCELFISTGDNSYYDNIQKHDSGNNGKAFSLTDLLSPDGGAEVYTSFDAGNTSGYGTLSLFLSPEGLSDDEKKSIRDSIIKAGKKYIDYQEKQGMHIPYTKSYFPHNSGIGFVIVENGYSYNSNETIINNALVLGYAYYATEDTSYLSAAAESMDYIFGRNALGFSYVSGYGENSMKNPYHRYWANGLNSNLPKTPDGVLSPGANSGLHDPYVKSLGFKNGIVDLNRFETVSQYAPQRCYVDANDAFSVNEVNVCANASLVSMLSFLQDATNKLPKAMPYVTVPQDQEPTTAPVATTAAVITTTKPVQTTAVDPNAAPATSPADTDSKVSGDANGDYDVSLADSLLILQNIANSKKYPLGVQATDNADCVDNGKGLTPMDALAVQMVDAKLIKAGDLPIKGETMEKLTSDKQ